MFWKKNMFSRRILAKANSKYIYERCIILRGVLMRFQKFEGNLWYFRGHIYTSEINPYFCILYLIEKIWYIIENINHTSYTSLYPSKIRMLIFPFHGHFYCVENRSPSYLAKFKLCYHVNSEEILITM